MKIALLDYATLGEDVDLSPLKSVGELNIYPYTTYDEMPRRIAGCQVVIANKLKLNRETLAAADKLKLICVTATGYDNVELAYCREKGIALCNVPGYSTDAVAQLTVAMVLSLSTHLSEYRQFVHSGAYTASGIPNRLTPVWQELRGKTWGILGCGNIGRQVARIADAFGCRVLVFRRQEDPEYETADLDTICREADILTVHLPLTDSTRNLLSKEKIAMLKKNAIVVNVARGAVADEEALTQAIETGSIAALGADAYTAEPFGAEHPFQRILSFPNVCLTPHTAWGALEARNRCIAVVADNIRRFELASPQNRIV